MVPNRAKHLNYLLNFRLTLAVQCLATLRLQTKKLTVKVEKNNMHKVMALCVVSLYMYFLEYARATLTTWMKTENFQKTGGFEL